MPLHVLPQQQMHLKYFFPKLKPQRYSNISRYFKHHFHFRHLYSHLMENGFIRNLDIIDRDELNIHADTVLEKIRRGEDGWQIMVPQAVVNIINERHLFRQGT